MTDVSLTCAALALLLMVLDAWSGPRGVPLRPWQVPVLLLCLLWFVLVALLALATGAIGATLSA